MANEVSKIKLPNDTTEYSLQDNQAIASITRSGTTFTATRRDGTSFSFTQQDNNTTYTFATGDNNGQIKVTPSGGTAQNVSVKGLGAAAYKGTTTSVTSGSSDLVTSGAVYTAIDNLPEPMVFKGSLGTGGTITTLPTASSANEGYTYKVITAGTYASQPAKVGDLFISNGTDWIWIPSGDEPSGTVTSITLKATSPIAIDSSSAITTSGTRTLSHANSGVTAGTYRSVTVNATGHVTAGTNPTTLSGYGITDAKIANGVITLGSNTITPLTSHQTVTDNNPTLAWGTKSKVATIGGTAINVTMPSNPNTDTKVTAVGNHYTPAEDSTAQLDADASSTTAATWNSTSLVTGITVKRDAKGHVTGIAVDSIKMPANPNTNTTYTIGTSGNNITLTPSSGSAQSITAPYATSAGSATKATQDGSGSTITSTYVKKSGDTMTGTLTLYKEGTTNNNYPTELKFQNKDTTTGKTSNGYIRAYDGGESGANIIINPAGNMFIGSGEAAQHHYDLYTHSTAENFYATADGNMYLQANGQTIANRLGVVIDTSHNIMPSKADTATNNVGSIGTSSYKWNAMYATTFYGALSGNANTATKSTNLSVPRVNTDCNVFAGKNTARIREYNPSSANLPTAHWYYVYEAQGDDTTYNIQLAFGETTEAAYYRVCQSNTWSSWKSLINTNTWRPVQNNLTSDSTTDSLSAAQGKALANGSARDSTKLPLAGGTVTGNVSAKFSTIDASSATNGVSSTQYPTTFNILDKSNRIMTRLEGVIESNGNIGAYWYVRNYNTSGTQTGQKGIKMTMANDGTLTYTVDDGAKFRSAIGAGTSSLALGTTSTTALKGDTKYAGASTAGGAATEAVTVSGTYSGNGGQQNPNYYGRNKVGFLMSNATVAGDTHYKNWIYMDNYHGDDVGGATAFGIDRTECRAFIMQSDKNRTSWNNTAALGVFTATPTSGQVIITDGTTGGIKSSGYTIAKSVPSDAKFTDTNTHRPIQVDGTEVLGNNTTALNLVAGTNVSLSNDGGAVTITATDTNNAVAITNTNPTTGTWYYPVWHSSTSATSTGLRANDGLRYSTLQGTASEVGRSILQIGNATASGTAGNKYGEIWLYSKTNGNVLLTTSANANKGYSQVFPSVAGIITIMSSTSITSGNIVIADGTSGGVKVSSYTIEKSVPSDAKFTDTNTHRPIKMNGTQILGNNTTAFNLDAGSNITLTHSDGTVTIAGTANNAVAQTKTTTDANYDILFSASTSGTDSKTEGARKNSNLKFNPSTGKLTTTSVDCTNIDSNATLHTCKYTEGVTNTTGYIMHGRDTSQQYSCQWASSKLNFYVGTTNIGNVSDRQLKSEIDEVDPKLLEAIAECKIYQYKAFNRDGLISVGIMAQDLVEKCEKRGIRPENYELLTKMNFIQGDDTLYYSVDYNQYATFMIDYLQKKVNELEEKIKLVSH